MVGAGPLPELRPHQPDQQYCMSKNVCQFIFKSFSCVHKYKRQDFLDIKYNMYSIFYLPSVRLLSTSD